MVCLRCVDIRAVAYGYTLNAIYYWDYENYCIYNDNGEMQCCIGRTPENFAERSHFVWEVVYE